MVVQRQVLPTNIVQSATGLGEVTDRRVPGLVQFVPTQESLPQMVTQPHIPQAGETSDMASLLQHMLRQSDTQASSVGWRRQISLSQIPQLWTENPQGWIKMVESRFAAANIDEDERKFDIAVGNLDSKASSKLAWYIDQPPPTGKWEFFKTAVLKMYGEIMPSSSTWGLKSVPAAFRNEKESHWHFRGCVKRAVDEQVAGGDARHSYGNRRHIVG